MRIPAAILVFAGVVGIGLGEIAMAMSRMSSWRSHYGVATATVGAFVLLAGVILLIVGEGGWRSTPAEKKLLRQARQAAMPDELPTQSLAEKLRQAKDARQAALPDELPADVDQAD